MIPLFTRRPDGTLMIEVSLDDLQKEWMTTPQKNKLILAGGRPAIRRPGDALDPSESIVTVHEAMWERVKFRNSDLELDEAPLQPGARHRRLGVEIQGKSVVAESQRLDSRVGRIQSDRRGTSSGKTG